MLISFTGVSALAQLSKLYEAPASKDCYINGRDMTVSFEPKIKRGSQDLYLEYCNVSQKDIRDPIAAND